MAEGRMLKKNVSTSRKLASLKSDSARLLWSWLLPYLDVAGRFSAEPDVVKGSVVPRLKHLTESKVEALLEELHQIGLINIYRIDGERYLELRKFDDFQTGLRKDREAPSKIPGPVPTNSGITPEEVPHKLREEKRSLSEEKFNTIAESPGDNVFEEIWEIWPRKEDEGKAREKYNFLVNVKKIGPERLQRAAIGYLRCEKSKGTEGDFIKYLKTFFYAGNIKKKIPGTWEGYEKYADDKYKQGPPL